MTETRADLEITLCCATFYQSELVQMLLGGVFHPGGLGLTHHLAEVIGLGPDDQVLDVACGRGATAVHLAEHFGCHVAGLDYGLQNVAAARAHAAETGVTHLTSFPQGDAGRLPFEDGTFSAVVSECSFCTFPDKAAAATEMARVLCHGGRLGLTDVTASGPLPDDIRGVLAWVACVAGAGTPQAYVAALQNAGFSHFGLEDRPEALLELVNDVRRRLLGVEVAAALGRRNSSTEIAELLGDLDLTEGKRLARRAIELIEGDVAGYTLIAAKKA